MAGPKIAAFRGIQDCKIAKITADTTSALTYDSLIDIPIKDLSFKPIVETYENKHDDLIQDVDTVRQKYEITGAMGRVSLDALAVMMGTDAVTASGSGDAEIQTLIEQYTDNPEYFKLETQSTRTFGSDGTAGDLHNVFYKCKITDMDWAIDDDFAVINFTASAIRTVNNGYIKGIVINETETAIA